MLSPTTLRPLAAILDGHGLADATEVSLEADGWSGAQLTVAESEGRRLVLKRDSVDRDWIARATGDGPMLREAWFASNGPAVPPPVVKPYLGVAADGDDQVLVMADLTGTLLPWETPIDVPTLDRVLDAIVALHAHPWPSEVLGAAAPWCPLRERLLLLSRPMAERYVGWGGRAVSAGERFLAGWDAFERCATTDAQALVSQLAHDPRPLLTALADLPVTLLHGDLKLANVGVAVDQTVPIVDWQMVMIGPVAVDLGWFLVSNSASLPLSAPVVVDRYRRAYQVKAARHAGDVDASSRRRLLDAKDVDLAWVVGLLLRGWRKGLDAEAGVVLPSGVRAADDLSWWCQAAVEAADRWL